MSLSRIITEIGEGDNYYNFRKVSDTGRGDSFTREYEFQTPENRYTVYFEKYSDERAVYVSFSDKRGTGKKVVTPTNEHVMIRVMSTVMHIAKKFKEAYPEHTLFKIQFPWFDKVDTSKRRRIYKMFIKKKFPEAEIKKIFRSLYVEL